jgi:predicted RNase H-like nuclease (RuvC/YqgF family)
LKYKYIFENQNQIMKSLLIVLIVMIMPLFVKAQVDYSMQSPLRDPITGGLINPITRTPTQRPNTPKLETVKPIATLTNVEKAKAKLAREEQKLIKLSRKEWDLEDDLKNEQEQLKNLENTLESSNDPDHQKKIEKLKQQIANSQDKINKAKTEVESESKKVDDLEKAIETAKYTRHD